MRRPLLAVLLALSLGLAACASDEPEAARDDGGAVATEGAVDAFDVEVGDCIQAPEGVQSEEGAEIESVQAVPCTAQHDGEGYALFDLPDGDYPGDQEVAAAGEQRCVEEFGAYVGLSYEESRLDITSLYPTEESWAELEDREYVCILVDPEGPLTGSQEGVTQ